MFSPVLWYSVWNSWSCDSSCVKSQLWRYSQRYWVQTYFEPFSCCGALPCSVVYANTLQLATCSVLLLNLSIVCISYGLIGWQGMQKFWVRCTYFWMSNIIRCSPEATCFVQLSRHTKFWNTREGLKILWKKISAI